MAEGGERGRASKVLPLSVLRGLDGKKVEVRQVQVRKRRGARLHSDSCYVTEIFGPDKVTLARGGSFQKRIYISSNCQFKQCLFLRTSIFGKAV